GLAIDCFGCDSVDGANGLCEDDFGPDSEIKRLLRRECRVGYFNFSAHFCVKIKGIKESGQTLMIRTCSVDNWGTQCGNIRFDQGSTEETIIGCLASCDMDGCNSSTTTRRPSHFLGISLSVITLTCALGICWLNDVLCS
ncbi:hypothetical protein LSAT2_030059, partial [Lamellibrachia satsuma]